MGNYPCPVLQHPKYFLNPILAGCWSLWAGCWRTGHGDHRPTLICKVTYDFGRPYCTFKVGRWSPCPVLPHPNCLLQYYFFWMLEDGARRPPSYYNLSRPSHEFFVFTLHSSFFTLHLTTPPSYYNLQGYSLPSPTGRGKPCASTVRGRGFWCGATQKRPIP